MRRFPIISVAVVVAACKRRLAYRPLSGRTEGFGALTLGSCSHANEVGDEDCITFKGGAR